jgi:hypothetical protein
VAKKKKGNKLGVFKAPGGNVKGIGKTGQFTGGLSPTVVAPKAGLSPRRVAPTILRGPGPLHTGTK